MSAADSTRIPQRGPVGDETGTEPRGKQNPSAGLEWFEPGIPAYHIESKCGRYTVSRVTVSSHNAVHYIAWRVKRDADKHIVGRWEIGSTQIPLKHTKEQRIEARERMQQRCADDAKEVA